MKKLFTSFAIAALCSISANAQNLQRNTPAAQNAQDISPVNVPAPVASIATDQQHSQEVLKEKPVNQDDRKGENKGRQFMDNAKNMTPEERQRMRKTYEEKREETKEKWRGSSSEEKKQILQNKEEKLKEREAKIDARQEKLQNLSPEEKARMEKHQEMMSKLSSQQRDDLKKEQERHRQEMKKITGFDMKSGERK